MLDELPVGDVASRSCARRQRRKGFAGETRDQKADAANEQKAAATPAWSNILTLSAPTGGSPTAIFIACIAARLADLLHEAKAFVGVDDRKRGVLAAGLVGVDGRSQFVEFALMTAVAGRATARCSRLSLNRSLARSSVGGSSSTAAVGPEIDVTAGEQIAALAGFGALDQAQHTRQLGARFQRMEHPGVVAIVACAKPERRGHDHGRQHGRGNEAPVEESQRSWLGSRIGQNRARVVDGVSINQHGSSK